MLCRKLLFQALIGAVSFFSGGGTPGKGDLTHTLSPACLVVALKAKTDRGDSFYQLSAKQVNLDPVILPIKTLHNSRIVIKSETILRPGFLQKNRKKTKKWVTYKVSSKFQRLKKRKPC